jgi:predicted molibdopterin-dependent oxidoreductase YjgC
MVRGDAGLEAVGAEAGLREAARRLAAAVEAKGAGSLVVLASPHATNEDLYVLRRFCDVLGVEAAGAAVVTGRSDDRLIQAEKAANAEGARRLGFGDPEPALERIRSGAAAAALVLGHDAMDEAWLGGPEALAGLDAVVLLDSHQSTAIKAAHVVLPTRVPAEKHGTLTNHAGIVQRVQPALEPAWDAWSEGELLSKLGQALGLEGFDGSWSPREISKAVAAAHPELAEAGA